MTQLPILYSFRRCPYAIRTRMTLKYCEIAVEHREVLLKDKPAAMLAASPKGTVPVLVLADNTVIDESVDIIMWALAQHDPLGWLDYDAASLADMHALVEQTERDFKGALDSYKYNYRRADDPRRQERNSYRALCVKFLELLNTRLIQTKWLASERHSYVDVALFPFVRQFANVEPDWFAQLPLPGLQRWLTEQLDSELFKSVMHKHPVWQVTAEPGQNGVSP